MVCLITKWRDVTIHYWWLFLWPNLHQFFQQRRGFCCVQMSQHTIARRLWCSSPEPPPSSARISQIFQALRPKKLYLSAVAMALFLSQSLFLLSYRVRNLRQFCSLVSAMDCWWPIFTHTGSNFGRACDCVHFARVARTGGVGGSQGPRRAVRVLLKYKESYCWLYCAATIQSSGWA